MKDILMRIIGFQNINKIIVPSCYKRPGTQKLEKKKNDYRKLGILQEIIVDKNNVLQDGFCSYYLARVWNIKYVKVRRCKKCRQ